MSDVRMINRSMSLGDKSTDAYEGRSFKMSNCDGMRQEQLDKIKQNQMLDTKHLILSREIDPAKNINSLTKNLFEAILKNGFTNWIERRKDGIETSANKLSRMLDRQVTTIELVQALDLLLLTDILQGRSDAQIMRSIILTYGTSERLSDLPNWAKRSTRQFTDSVLADCQEACRPFQFDLATNVAALQYDRTMKEYRNNREIISRKLVRKFEAIADCYYSNFDQTHRESTKCEYSDDGLLETVRFYNGVQLIIFTVNEFASDGNVLIDDETWGDKTNFLGSFGWEHKFNSESGLLFYNKHHPSFTMYLGFIETDLVADNDETDPDTMMPPTD